MPHCEQVCVRCVTAPHTGYLYMDESGTHEQSAGMTFLIFATSDPTLWRSKMEDYKNQYGHGYLRFAKIENRGQARFKGTRALFTDLCDPRLMPTYYVHVLYADRSVANKVHFGRAEHVMQNHFRAQLIRHRTARIGTPCYLVIGKWRRKSGDNYFPATVQSQLDERDNLGRGPRVELQLVRTRDCHLLQIADAIAGAYALQKQGRASRAVKAGLSQILYPAINSRVFPWDWRPP